MARLKYNHCYTFLNGDLDAVDTTNIAILDPLKEGGPGGSNIATISSPDVLVMSVDDEVIYVTAYTTATTTLTTVLRGQEGTVAAAHTNGTRIYSTPSKDDFIETSDIKGPMTLTVAAADSPQIFKDRADYLCDYTADNVQIQAAIDLLDAAADAGTIEFAPGSYDIAAALSIPTAAKIKFAGVSLSFWNASGRIYWERNNAGASNYSFITLVGGSTQVEFDGIEFDSYAVNTSPFFAMNQLFAKLFFVECQAYNYDTGNAPVISITASGCHVVARRCTLEADEAAIECTGTTLTSGVVDLDDCSLFTDSATKGCLNLAVGGGWNIFVKNCEAWLNSGHAYRIDGNVSNTPMPVVEITGGRCDSNALENIYITDCLRLRIQDVLCNSSGEHDIRLSNVDSGYIRGCTIGGCGKHGIWMLDCEDMLVQGNSIDGVGADAASTYSGIILDGNTDTNLIQNNVIRGSSALYGIRVDDSTCNNNTIVNNDLAGASATAGNEFSDAGTGTVAGLEPTLLSGWYQDNVVASQTAVVLNLPLAGRSEITMPADGYVVGVIVRSNEARTAGTLTVDPTINGTVTGLTAVLDGTNTQTKTTRQGNSADKFTAGQRIGVKLTTDAGWLPVTADIDVSVLVTFNTANRI